MVLGFGTRWDARRKNCFVTGGSQGLGLSLAVLLAKRGANVTVIARNVDRLKLAVDELEKHRQTPEQTFRFHSFPLNTFSGSYGALEAESEALSQQSDGSVIVPDAFFLCAGSARPSFFIENSEENLINGMEQAYWAQAWSAHAAFKKLVYEQRPGKIIFVGSVVSLMSFVGYASYSPGKHALKGLAETLRSEGVLYGIDTHIFYAPTMQSPGLEEESKTKPGLTKNIEDGDAMLTCDDAAAILLEGVERGDYSMTGTFLSRIISNANRGTAPLVNAFIGPILDCIHWIAIPFWRRSCDSQILKAQPEHQKYLEAKGLVRKSRSD